jgi:dTMP kinase
MAGAFIVFEGIDGSGKSTAIGEISARLEPLGLSCIALREPTEKTDASREIRRILRTAKEVDAKISKDLLELFLIDRLWDLKHQILPALAAGKIVLLDRYFFSTAAYQAMDSGQIQAILDDYLANHQIRLPELVVFLDLPVNIALARMKSRAQLDVFETEARLTRIAQNYREVFRRFGEMRSKPRVDVKTGELTAADFEALSARIRELALAEQK